MYLVVCIYITYNMNNDIYHIYLLYAEVVAIEWCQSMTVCLSQLTDNAKVLNSCHLYIMFFNCCHDCQQLIGKINFT